MICWQGQQICGGWIAEHFLGYGGYDRRGLWFSLFGAALSDACAVYRLCRAELQALQGGGRKAAQLRGLFAVLLLRTGVQTDRFADRREFQLGLSAAAPCARSTFSLSRCTRQKPSRLLDNFSLFYLYPRGDGGTAAVPDVDVASGGGELHVLAFDERAHSACGLSHHAVFGR